MPQHFEGHHFWVIPHFKFSSVGCNRGYIGERFVQLFRKVVICSEYQLVEQISSHLMILLFLLGQRPKINKYSEIDKKSREK